MGGWADTGYIPGGMTADSPLISAGSSRSRALVLSLGWRSDGRNISPGDQFLFIKKGGLLWACFCSFGPGRMTVGVGLVGYWTDDNSVMIKGKPQALPEWFG